MLIPPRQRRRLLGSVDRASIINSSNAALMAADVVKHCLDDMRRYADIGHAGGYGTPDIVDNPAGYAGALIEFALAGAPRGGPENSLAIAR